MRGIVAATVLVAVLLIAACTSDMRVVTSGLRPTPVVVHDGPYRWKVDGIVEGFYRTPRGGYCWNYRYRSWPVGAKNCRLNYAFACQRHNGRWVAYKNQRESPANRSNRSQVNLHRLIQQMLR